MSRWRTCFLLAMLLLLPTRITPREDEEDEEKSSSRGDEEEDDDSDDDDEEDEPLEKEPPGRRAPAVMMQTSPRTAVTRTTKRRPLECYVCAYKPESPLRACLDPTKYRVHTMTCHSVDEKCVTSVSSKGNTYEAVVRGCRSGCLGSPDTTCCELNRCNNQAFAMPTVIAPRALAQENKSDKTLPTSVLFFVTILLLLQTVVKVTIV
ncbi:uncharacterized protein LOC123710671 isoform X1 [Pieris brassicae]|uniref:uncharacterized protein LOC123710671 isoform X1 n=1 Tax=Pieris brassicae TaxID=7116 RepID=UPI001E661620|nr:uncharacterized protein LOC123710671 isoform X1 [Pieris brassicae]